MNVGKMKLSTQNWELVNDEPNKANIKRTEGGNLHIQSNSMELPSDTKDQSYWVMIPLCGSKKKSSHVDSAVDMCGLEEP